jgi:hypothetical protein
LRSTRSTPAVSGTLTGTGTKPDDFSGEDSSTGHYYTATLQGDAITTHLLPTYEDTSVALVVRVGQDVRVYGTTIVRAARPASAA